MLITLYTLHKLNELQLLYTLLKTQLLEMVHEIVLVLSADIPSGHQLFPQGNSAAPCDCPIRRFESHEGNGLPAPSGPGGRGSSGFPRRRGEGVPQLPLIVPAGWALIHGSLLLDFSPPPPPPPPVSLPPRPHPRPAHPTSAPSFLWRKSRFGSQRSGFASRSDSCDQKRKHSCDQKRKQ